ncbi:PREDICTED: sperm-associated antigen 11A-like [Chrysochloris asiatica]|uniref:Sperm-associated antigen 11A-like n=1 Tax=Chrysochloris asiatica TaxID=185453 RepID=A0A9B0TMS4_CHRAS|nr:PREDICTED: sperm-associated antigen 11A-like [Chrysochloris asiatica]
MAAGLSSAKYVNHQGIEDHRESRASSEQRTNEFSLLHYQVKRQPFQPRTPPFPEEDTGLKIIICKKSDGHFCQKYCNYLETQMGYCSEKKDACCAHPN